jgi:hypothetical protein
MTTTQWSASLPGQAWDVCDHCQAPLEARQRYCVECGSRRLHGDDPAARYLTELTRRARTSEPVTAPPPRRSTWLVPLVLALVPLAAAAGVLVGRGQGAGDDRIVAALRAQRPPIVNVVPGATAAAGAAAAAAAPESTAKTAAKARKRSAAKGDKEGGRVLARGPAGDARQIEGARVTDEQRRQSREAVKRINESKGKAYVESQRHLPDQIVIP